MIRAGALLLLAVAGCRSHAPYRTPSGEPEAVYAALVEDGKRGIPREDEALWRCETASAALLVGDEAAAFKALDGATRIMGTLESSTAEDARAILGAEATKTWKGDPHERCMSALYKGLLYWRRGDLGNASACFKSGLLADAYSAEGEHQQDFAVLSFLLGWVSHLRGRGEQARFSFAEAAANNPGNPYFADPRPGEHNVLVVADVGSGPRKYADGSGGSIARYEQPAHPDAAVEILVDGAFAGRSAMGTELYLQAVTRGKRVLDGIRQGKVIFKDAAFIAGVIVLDEAVEDDSWEMAAVGAGLLLLSALTNPRADTRHWTLLPAEVHVLPLRIEPGPHELRVQVLDRGGLPIAGWSRTFAVDVPAGNGTLYYVRSVPADRIYGLFGESEPCAPSSP